MNCTGHHTQRGATKEKSRKLDELRAKRKAKDEKKRVCERFFCMNKVSLI